MVWTRMIAGSATIAALTLTAACLPGGEEDASEAPGSEQLTQEEADSVLPTADQLPQDLRIDEEADEDVGQDEEATSYPATCLDLELDGDEGKALEEHEVVKAYRGYASPYGGVVSLRVISHDIDIPEKLFDDAGKAMTKCAEYSKIDKQGTTRWEVEPAGVTNLGERTYAITAKMLSGDKQFVGGTVQLVGITVGHNLVYIVYSAGPYSSLSTNAVQDLADTALQNLEDL